MPTKPSNPKDLAGSDKLPLHLWPETATIWGCLALLHGALKYGQANWRVVGVRVSIYYDALRRHMNAYMEGEDIDPESGLPHMACGLACLALLVDAQAAGKLTDDRHYPGGYLQLVPEATKHVARLKRLHRKTHRERPKHYTIREGG